MASPPKKSKEKVAVVQYNNKVWEPTIGYIGETKGGQRHGTVESFSKEEEERGRISRLMAGFGKYVYPNRLFWYEGQWEKGQKHGGSLKETL